MASNVVLSEVEYRVVGKRPIRPDGVDKVTGRAQYGADINLVGLLQGKILRSPHAHARIVSIDTSRAEALPGVKAVVTSQDLPLAGYSKEELGGDYLRFKFASDHVLASDKVLFKGHPVAAVAAANQHVAEEAAKLISVVYEELPAVVDVQQAMLEDAPLLHDGLYTSSLGETSKRPSNVAAHLRYEKGDTEQGFAEADVVVEREFTTAPVHQGYIEPHNGTAFWNADGQLNIWTSTQGAFQVRAAVSDVLRHPVSKIRVTPMEIGGGFGGKIPAYLDAIAAVLSRKTGAPVKLTMSRIEVLKVPDRLRQLVQDQDRSHQGRQVDCMSGHDGLRSGCLSGFSGDARHHLCIRVLRRSQRLGGRLRRGGQYAQVGGVSGSRFASGRVRCGVGDRRN